MIPGLNPALLPGRRLRFIDAPPATGEQNPTGQAAAAAAGAAAGGDAVVTLTQAQLTALTSKEKDQGRRAALAALATELGFTDAAEVRTFVEAARARETAGLTDLERREREVADRERAQEVKDAQTAQREQVLTRKDALRDLGAAGDNLRDALALLGADLPFGDHDEDAVRTAAAAVAARRPELFATAGAPRPPAPAGVPSTRPPASGQPNQPVPGERGKAMAARRFGDRARASA